MADRIDPRTGERVTPNYRWTKPTVGASDDAWGGMINANLDGIDGVVHAIDTRPFGVTVSDTPPANPLVGQEWFDGVSGQLYVWYDDGNSSQWVIAVNAAASLLPATTTVLGAVKVDGTTIEAAPDGTISTTVVPMGDNRIINGDMRIDQRNNGASGTAANVYTVDRWIYASTQSSKGTWGRGAPNPTIASFGFSNFLGFTSSSAYTPLATDAIAFEQPIEADMITDFMWGTPNAQPVTLSFMVWCSLAGTFGGAITNSLPATRSYPFSFNIPVASTWTKIIVTIPGDTSGTWTLFGNGLAAAVFFDLGSGATFRAPAGAWANGNLRGATGAVSVVGTNAASFYFTGVKLETGSVATPFNRQSLAKSMADCQRYYINTYAFVGGYAAASGVLYAPQTLPTTMRANPTVAFVSPAYSNASALVSPVITTTMVGLTASVTATGNAYGQGTMTLSAEL